MTGAKGVGTFVRHFLRRDRWTLLWWTIGVTLLYWSQAVSVDGLYQSQAEFDKAAATMQGNAALVAMAGPARALNTIGGQVTWQATAFGAVVAGLMSMFLIGRHTRGEEESGRDELLRAAAVDRHAPMTAALIVAMIANVLIGAGVAVSLAAYPLAVADSLALGIGLTVCGWVFSALALLAAQVTSTTRAMYGITGAVIGVAYGLRAIGDLGNEVLTWLSPIGWYQGMHAFSGLRWWPVVLLLGAFVVTGAAAYAVFGRRDFGAGIVPARPGPARAGAGLASGFGLAWRLQRGSVIGWSLGLLVTGLAYGSMGSDVGDMIGDSKATREMFVQSGGDLVDGFYATAIVMLTLIACGFAVSSALRPRTEEDEGRVESLLATALPRNRWLLGHVAVTVLGSLVVVAASGIGLGVGYGLAAADVDKGVDLVMGTLPYVAPVLVLSAVARLLYGVSTRLGLLAWLALLFCVVILFFGPLFRMPDWVQGISPFHHLALVPAEGFEWAPFVALFAVAALVSAAGQLAFRRRDVH